ncbi:esterase E4-like [Eriocheir sinensis]|uniref:esterase E4-like n=1 Tax=Eriocheir sinensis TaxID=95602 RepID=UPI0021C640FC|nr:esterase E4-like [Eriocheir sinensis]
MKTVTTAVVVVTMVVAAAGGAAAKEVPLVDTEEGRVAGVLEKTLKGREFFSFYGIPFAQPPLEKLRFKDPEAPSSWEGTRDASIPAEPCPQVSYVSETEGGKEIFGSEDCLYLNVFSNQVKEEGELPVMVFIHGGGFVSGTSGESEPYVLLDHDVVLVVVQYRLSIFGFLSTEDSVMPGNLGLKDQTMALQWVQRNIHRFGGDKTRVTIFGESAGGASVHYQMLTPKSEGLFSRAILHSASALCPWALNAKPREAALQVADSLGCPTDRGSEALLDCLQGLEAYAFVPLQINLREWDMLPFTFTPWVDGEYLPEHPAQLVLEGRHAQVDIMAGSTRDEGAFFTLPALQTSTLFEELQNNFSVAGPASLTLSGQCEDPVAVARQVYLHYSGTTHVTEAHAESLNKVSVTHTHTHTHDPDTAFHSPPPPISAKTFRYELQHYGQYSFSNLQCPSCDREWVNHGDDLFYLFTPGPLLGLPSEPPQSLQRPDDLAVSDIMTTLWTNFATTGNPTPDDSLGFKWEPSTADNLHYLSLTPSPSMQPDNRKEVRKFHNSLPTTKNLILHPHLVRSGVSRQKPTGCHSKIEL